MARKDRDEHSLPRLTVPKEEAADRIRLRMEEGQKLRKGAILNTLELREAERVAYRWHKYNRDLLTLLFDDPAIARDYYALGPGGPVRGPVPLSAEVSSYHDKLTYRISNLRSVLDRLELFAQVEPVRAAATEAASDKDLSQDVFVVHGRDVAAKQSVARFLSGLGLHPIILHEQPGGGRTIIEKFEHYSSVGFAVVLLTPDDVGGPADGSAPTEPRARQNVIFELGYFIGRLGRERVRALYAEGVEIPSDYRAVEYILLDPGGGWQLPLAREIAAAGIDIDLDGVLKKK